MSVIRPFLPHLTHLCGVGLEVSEILFSQAGLFVYFYRVPWERGGFAVWGGGCEGIEDPFGCFSCSSVGRSEEMKGV